MLVIEAGLNSGTLITARKAAEQGRQVFALPGSLNNPMAKGCHRLIREGARLVETTADIMQELGPVATELQMEIRHGVVQGAGQGEYIAPLLRGFTCGDQGAAVQPGLYDQYCKAQARNDPVA